MFQRLNSIKSIVFKLNETLWISGEHTEKAVSIDTASENAAGAAVSASNAAED